jgi:energy-coupling factor transporter ATP-binding protein EcfA2
MITKVRIQGYRIYRDLLLQPNPGLNLIVGANESGKSTLMEAVALALTGRINGRSANEELNPYWFNVGMVEEFVAKRTNREPCPLPEIRIELFLEDKEHLQQLCGAINTAVPTTAVPGVTMKVAPNLEYEKELDEWAKDPSALLPVEYYTIDWRSFADDHLLNRPKELTTAIIDSRTLRSSNGVDYHMRQILSDGLAADERAQVSLAYRQVKATMSEQALKSVNNRISKLHGTLHDRPITIAMDQTARTSWEGAITPHVDNVPFSMSGQGQQAAIKISLAMSRHSERTKFVMIEEPENHLSHTSLTTLLARIESLAGEHQQLFVTTHSSFVLNRLGLDALLLLGDNTAQNLANLTAPTVAYFQKLPGYDTLRMALAKKVVLVEGPSDEIVFERIFKDLYDKRPMDLGIDVISMRGLSLGRCLELCAALDKTVAAIRDNDGIEPAELRTPLEQWLAGGKRELFVGEIQKGETLEPQLLSHNSAQSLREVLQIADSVDIAKWMKREKTEGAIRIASSALSLKPPEYLRAAAVFIHG